MLNPNESFQRKYINALLLISILILIFLGFLSFREINKISEANNWVVHSHEVIEIADNVLININFAESRQRGFLLTGDKSYITLFHLSNNEAYQNAQLLHTLTQDNKPQQALADKLVVLVNARISLLNQVLQLSATQGIKTGVDLILRGQGKILSDQISKTCALLITKEKEILLKRNNIAFSNIIKITTLILIGDTASLGLILFCVILLNRQINLRQTAEQKLIASGKELHHLAYYDPLTELPNRIALVKQIDKLITEQQFDCQLALLLVDIDNFKNVNDSFGYEIGDQLLKSFAIRLGAMARTEDFVAHLSSDKFAIILTDIDQAKNAGIVAKKVLDSLVKPILVSNHTIFITASIGVSIYPSNGIDAKTLLKNADIAIYHAKELGKNNYQFCTPELTLEVEGKALLDYHLHHALKADEFMLLYQPKISLTTGKVNGVEALMRWNRPDIGIVYPDSFIGLAESNGLIVPIGEWIIRKACVQGQKWIASGLPKLNIAINISTRQFIISDIVSNIKDIIRETGFDPHYLELEITETLLMKNSINNIAALRELKKMGIKITIDDFGTGYSSLNYLKMLAVDKLKIDKSFVQDITVADQNHGIINAIIVMAHSLNIQVIAEGVETQEQTALLSKYHCDEGQGFFYSHPLPADDIPAFLADH